MAMWDLSQNARVIQLKKIKIIYHIYSQKGEKKHMIISIEAKKIVTKHNMLS